MNFDFATLENLRRNHPAWRLLQADHAPFIVGFLYRAFLKQNVRSLPEAELMESLEDELFALRAEHGAQAFPRRAQDYLNDWASNDRGWLRKFYPPNAEEPYFDLTPATEKAVAWIESLGVRSFVGTESRLLTLFDLLRQIASGSEADPQLRIAELRKRRDELDREIARIEEGDVSLLGETALRDRFQQFTTIARELLGDFREVEHNFRSLDRQVRERVTLWEGAKGALLDEILGERDAIADSDQGRSFRAFWDFLMSQERQEELTGLLERVLQLPAIAATGPEKRLRRVHYDWLEAGEHTQRSVAQLSHQLRRFIDDRAYLENRRIMDLLRRIEIHAVGLRGNPPQGDFMKIASLGCAIELPMERRMFSPVSNPAIVDSVVLEGDAPVDLDALFSQVVIDYAKLSDNVRRALQKQDQVTLRAVIDAYPVEQGLAEVVAYLQLAARDKHAFFDEDYPEPVAWQDATGQWKSAGLSRVVFARP